jgi:hypothetical protein
MNHECMFMRLEVVGMTKSRFDRFTAGMSHCAACKDSLILSTTPRMHIGDTEYSSSYRSSGIELSARRMGGLVLEDIRHRLKV